MARGTKGAALAPDDEQQLLGNWQLLNKDLLRLSEVAVRQLLAAEMAGKRRTQVLLRLYHRFSRVRGDREKRKLFMGELPWR